LGIRDQPTPPQRPETDVTNATVSKVATLSLLFVIGAANVGAQRAAPLDSARPATIERFLQVSGAERQYREAFETSLRAQLTTNPQLAPLAGTLREFAAKYQSYESLKPHLVRFYRESVSDSDLVAAIHFYQSPAGRRLTAAAPRVVARVNELSVQQLQAHLPELLELLQRKSAGGSTGGTPASPPPR
jgi:hypothetical protein